MCRVQRIKKSPVGSIDLLAVGSNSHASRVSRFSFLVLVRKNNFRPSPTIQSPADGMNALARSTLNVATTSSPLAIPLAEEQEPTEQRRACAVLPVRSTLLGTGTLNEEGTAVEEFLPGPHRLPIVGGRMMKLTKKKMAKAAVTKNNDTPPSPARARSMDDEAKQQQIVFKRAYSSFLRVADLEMDETVSLRSTSEDSDESYPNFHRISVDPPPGVETDPKERWVVLDDGDGKHAPIAPLAVRALARSGLESCFDEKMWTPDSKTQKILKQTTGWQKIVWTKEGTADLPTDGSLNEADIFLWTGTFKHGHYGSELPAVRSCGVINVSPKALMELLVDSDRVKEYNKFCVGRTDLLVLQDSMDKSGAFGGITKVMKTESKPPMVRKLLRFTSLLHGRELEDGSGFKIVTRAVTLPEQKEDLANALKSEILLGATIIKRIEGHDNRCLFISVNHLRSPMVPMMIAKRLGLQAAVGFIHDLRGCCT